MTLVLAETGAKALWLLFIWLGSAIICQWLSEQKGYGEKAGLGTGLLLSAVGIPIWLLIRPKSNSKWAHRRTRRRAAAGKAPSADKTSGEA